MTETAASLIKDMYEFYQNSYPETDIDLAPKFASRVRALGESEFLLYVFQTFADSELSFWMGLLNFVWRDISFKTWLRILEALSDDRRLVYRFLWFASSTLAIDIGKLDASHPNVRAELMSDTFRHGGAKPMSRALRARLEDDFDYESVWHRLAREGAPMQEFLSN